VNTSLVDLGPQLEFLGIEKAWTLLSKLEKSAFRHIGDQHANYGVGGRRHGSGEPEMPRLGNFYVLNESCHHDTAITKADIPRHVNYSDVSSTKGKLLLLLL
jgi:hypothetical protein